MNTNLILSAFLMCASIGDGARILGIFHPPSLGHYSLSSTLMKKLAEKGHQVTVINPYPQKTPLKNYKDVALVGFVEQFEDQRKNFFDLDDANFILAEVFTNVLLIDAMEDVLKRSTVQDLLKSDELFDLVIVEELNSYALYGFCHYYKVPCVSFVSIGLSRLVSSQMGNPISPAYVPDYLLSYNSNMSFLQRLHNSFVYLFSELFKHWYVFPRHDRILQKYFPGAPPITELYYNISLALVNGHVSIQPPVPLQPNVIDIGGFHVQPPKKLPKDLQEYLNDAQEGAVFFSMGSNLQSVDMPLEKRNAILKAFSRLKLKVLWKWEDENLEGKPSNVKIQKWLPQNDVLAHPNIKLFITHGGLLSTIEATYHGVPIVGIPIYGDQKMNLANAVNNGLGLGVPYSTLTEEALFSAIEQVLANPKYMVNAKRRSKIMQDQPMKPLDKAVFWVEYVMRHHGAVHLRSAALNLTWYQYLLLDVAAVLLVAFLAVVAVICFVIKKCCCKKYSSSCVPKRKKTN